MSKKIIESNARKEFECIYKENQKTGEPRCILTDKVSRKINELNDTIQASNLFDNTTIREIVLKAALPPTLLEKVRIEDVLKRVPENYTKAIFGAYLSATFIYSRGLSSNEFSFFDFMRTLMENKSL